MPIALCAAALTRVISLAPRTTPPLAAVPASVLLSVRISRSWHYAHQLAAKAFKYLWVTATLFR